MYLREHSSGVADAPSVVQEVPPRQNIIEGTVVEIISAKDSPNKWIGVRVETEPGTFKEYKLYLSYVENPDMTPVVSGKEVVLSYDGNLSETEYAWGRVVTIDDSNI